MINNLPRSVFDRSVGTIGRELNVEVQGKTPAGAPTLNGFDLIQLYVDDEVVLDPRVRLQQSRLGAD